MIGHFQSNARLLISATFNPTFSFATSITTIPSFFKLTHIRYGINSIVPRLLPLQDILSVTKQAASFGLSHQRTSCLNSLPLALAGLQYRAAIPEQQVLSSIALPQPGYIVVPHVHHAWQDEQTLCSMTLLPTQKRRGSEHANAAARKLKMEKAIPRKLLLRKRVKWLGKSKMARILGSGASRPWHRKWV